jgi:hypothetical protein
LAVNFLAYFQTMFPDLVNLCVAMCKKEDKRHWKEYELEEHEELARKMRLEQLKKRLVIKELVKNPKAQNLMKEVQKEYNRRINVAMDIIISPQEEEFTKDELGIIYDKKKVNMRIKKYSLGSKGFKQRLEAIRKRRERKEKELEGIEELSAESAVDSEPKDSNQEDEDKKSEDLGSKRAESESHSDDVQAATERAPQKHHEHSNPRFGTVLDYQPQVGVQQEPAKDGKQEMLRSFSSSDGEDKLNDKQEMPRSHRELTNQPYELP